MTQCRKEGGAWLRRLREERGLSQRQLAQALNIEYYTFISQVEAGRGRVPPERYEDLAKALGVPPRALVKQLLFFYDPFTYRFLFEEAAGGVDGEDGGRDPMKYQLGRLADKKGERLGRAVSDCLATGGFAHRLPSNR